MHVQETVDQIKELPGAVVDCSFGQGREMFLKQLEERTGKDESFSVDAYIESSRNSIADLVKRFAPFNLPDDYIFFLEHYGGLLIEGNDYTASTLGTGPMVEDWYASVNSDEVFWKLEPYAYLTVGSLSIGEHPDYQFQRVTFFLDIGGTVQKYCVIGVGPWGKETLSPLEILAKIHTYPDRWQKVANSFTEWLEQAANTNGTFGYI